MSNKRYQTVDLNFQYHWLSGGQTVDTFIAAIELPRKLSRWYVDMRPTTKAPYLVITRDETEQERDERIELTDQA